MIITIYNKHNNDSSTDRVISAMNYVATPHDKSSRHCYE